MRPLDLLGYFGSVLVVLSLATGSVLRLRWLNLAGALAGAAYGVWLAAPPVVALNGVVAVLDAWHLARLYGVLPRWLARGGGGDDEVPAEA